MKFKTFYTGSLDESKKRTLASYEKSYQKYWDKFKNTKRGGSPGEKDKQLVAMIFKKMMEDGWTKEEIHMYK